MPKFTPHLSSFCAILKIVGAILLALLIPHSSSLSQEYPLTPREKNDLEFIKKILPDHYIEPQKLSPALASPRIDTMLRSLRGGAFTRRFATRPASLPPILAMLPKEIAYFRPRAFDSAFPTHAIRRLQYWRTGKIAGLIIDLRGLQGGSPTETYAKILAILDGRGDATLQWNKNKIYVSIDPLPSPIPTRILISEHTSGLYETIALILKSPHTQLIGQPTPGRAAVFKEFAMPSGDFIGIAHCTLTWRDQPIPFGTPLIPDQYIDTPFAQLARSLHYIETGQVRRLFLYSTKETLQKDPTQTTPTSTLQQPPQDQAILQAWDSLRALTLLQIQSQVTHQPSENVRLPTPTPNP
jgi:hypothetical protein